jgi:Mrp family chromosome partitioning ATPase
MTERDASREHAFAAENALQEFKRKHRIYSFAEERAKLIEQRAKAQEQSSLIINAGLKMRIADYNRQLENLDSLEREYRILQKESEVAGDAYSIYSRKYDEAKAFEDLERERLDSVRIIQPSTVPAEPERLQPLIVLGGFLVSLISVFATAAVTELLQGSFHTSEEIGRITSLPVLAVFEQAAENMENNMRYLVQRLALPGSRDPRVINFISARSGEGTTQISWEYAALLAKENEQKVLLMDAGGLSAQHYARYGFLPEVGIVEKVMAGESVDKAIYKVEERLSICRLIHNSNRRGQIGNVIHNETFWKDLSEKFDTIVIDTSPLQNSFDGVVLAVKSDLTVIVTEAEKTPQAVVKNLCDTLITAGAKVAGVVLNKRLQRIPHHVYEKL